MMIQTDDAAKVGSVRKRRGVTGRLVTVPRLAEMLACSRQTALTITIRHDFPAPFDVLAAETDRPQEVWLRKDVDRWLADNPEPVRRKR
jgi:hypothetical protein